MPLAEYRRKRNFASTHEPTGQRAGKPGFLFVVQKHDASRLHYDFRIELDGVLKSWAVPKGPSLDPSQKRLAIEVEDHPLEYGGFEGTIPQGDYGGGTVMLWDRGDWEPVGADPADDYRQGRLKFRLRGKKLSGGWMLVRTRRGRGNKSQWLLIKERDQAARATDDYDVTEQEPLSVASHRDLAQIASSTGEWRSPRHRTGHGAARRPKTMKVGAKKRARSALPAIIKPQMATAVKDPPADDRWLHEIKFDGYRVLAHLDDHQVRFQTRGGLDWTEKFPELVAALSKLKVRQAVLDGEVVALNAHGVSDFQALQAALSTHRRGSLVYAAFDLLGLDGHDLRTLPLVERKKRLQALKLPVDRGPVRYVEHLVGHGEEFFAQAEKLGLEGIVSKRVDRPYLAGRGTDWLKIKCQNNAEFVIGGYTDPSGSRQGFGALLLGYYDPTGHLRYAGRVGTGFPDALLDEVSRRLRRLEVDAAPFTDAAIKRRRQIHWVRPALVAQIRFSNWTRDGSLRHPVFLGLREDKPAASVHRERAKSTAGVVADGGPNSTHRSRTKRRSSAKGSSPTSPTRHGPARTGHDEAFVAGERLTHPDKVLYPEDGLTKRDLADYYPTVARWMLPHVVDRPLSIVRCPDGLSGQRFFQKHPGPGMLKRLRRVAIKQKDVGAEFVVIREAADLVALAQVGALELHICGARADRFERPDRLVFDLDPAPDVGWKQIVAAANEVRQFLKDLGLESFVKTSGGKGLHVVVPIDRRHDWDSARNFCRGVAFAVARAAPERYVPVMSKAARAGKIFIDYLRNQPGATAVAPYSTRARAGAPVAMPLAWDELPAIRGADQFKLATVPQYLRERRHDPWAKMIATRQRLSSEILTRLEA